MSNYRRAAVPGAAYFFTVALADRRSRVLVEHAARCGLPSSRRREHPVRVDAMVVLPDHLHAVWRLPEGDADFPLRWRKLKSRFTRAVGGEWRRSASQAGRVSVASGSGATGAHDPQRQRLAASCGIPVNPVKHGLVGRSQLAAFVLTIVTCAQGWCRRTGAAISSRASSASEGRGWVRAHPTVTRLVASARRPRP